VKEHLEKFIWAFIIVPGLIAIVGGWRAQRKAQQAAA
jgi:membrane-associated protein